MDSKVYEVPENPSNLNWHTFENVPSFPIKRNNTFVVCEIL